MHGIDGEKLNIFIFFTIEACKTRLDGEKINKIRPSAPIFPLLSL